MAARKTAHAPGTPPGNRARPGVLERVAAAPISWGVCEVPGWGHQLTPERVLTEMRELEVVATEFGPDGFLPDDPDAKARLLASYGMTAVGGFVPVVLHHRGLDPLPAVDRALDGFVAAGAGVLVLAAATGQDGYDSRPVLDDTGWTALLSNLDRIAQLAADRGITATLHPHVGTMIENSDEVHRVLDGSDVPLCLDTGHLLIGGTDPVELTRQAPDRIAHTHLKDVDAALTAQVRAGEISYTEAVRRRIYRPLGDGDIDITEIVTILENRHYTGWYVMEQDTILTAEPAGDGSPGTPVTDVRTSIEYLRRLVAERTEPDLARRR